MTTKLEVINSMLRVVGEQPVSSARSQHPTAISAMTEIDRISRKVQLRGWWFNKEYSIKLLPLQSGELILPSNTLKVDPVDTSSPLVKRGNRLYDPTTSTFIINSSAVVDLVLQLEIEDLPETAASYIQEKCCHEFYVNEDGDAIKAREIEKRMIAAWTELKSEDLQADDVNAASRPAVRLLMANGNAFSGNPMFPGGRG